MGSLMYVSTLTHAGNGVRMSWVTLERITRAEAAKDDSLLRKLDADRRPLRPASAGLTDLLTKVESGHAAATPAFIGAVARALRVDVPRLTGQPYEEPPATERGCTPPSARSAA